MSYGGFNVQRSLLAVCQSEIRYQTPPKKETRNEKVPILWASAREGLIFEVFQRFFQHRLSEGEMEKISLFLVKADGVTHAQKTLEEACKSQTLSNVSISVTTHPHDDICSSQKKTFTFFPKHRSRKYTGKRENLNQKY